MSASDTVEKKDLAPAKEKTRTVEEKKLRPDFYEVWTKFTSNYTKSAADYVVKQSGDDHYVLETFFLRLFAKKVPSKTGRSHPYRFDIQPFKRSCSEQALELLTNPELKKDEVREILQKYAQKYLQSGKTPEHAFESQTAEIRLGRVLYNHIFDGSYKDNQNYESEAEEASENGDPDFIVKDGEGEEPEASESNVSSESETSSDEEPVKKPKNKKHSRKRKKSEKSEKSDSKEKRKKNRV